MRLVTVVINHYHSHKIYKSSQSKGCGMGMSIPRSNVEVGLSVTMMSVSWWVADLC